jgi:hypothetical protein
VAILVLTVVLTAITVSGGHALAQTFNSGSTGADGAFNPTTNSTLALPPNGIFNFTTINIPVGVTVTFTRNATNTPVTLLASGNVTIAGTINLNGGAGRDASTGTTIVPNGGAGGPGGFGGGDGADGITTTTGGAGLGPGGGAGGHYEASFQIGSGGGGGSFGTAGASSGRGATPGATYGVQTLLPLIGGSGGGGGAVTFGFTAAGGGGGGGAILVAASGTLSFTGSINANGGNGGTHLTTTNATGAGAGGSGGAVRLVATTIIGGGGSISVMGGSSVCTFNHNCGGSGGSGRIRIEAYTNTAIINFAQVPSVSQPGAVALPSAPTLRITSVAGVAAPAAPTGSFTTPDILVPAGTANPMTIGLASTNIPLGTTVTVTRKPLNGEVELATSTPLSGTLSASTATASLTIPPNQPSVISASATFTLASLPGAGPVYAAGEEVERIRVAAVLGSPSTITYITKSGREVLADVLLEK